MTFTQQEIDTWINELGIRASQSDWSENYRFGFGQGLIAVRARMDDEIKKRKLAA